MSTKEKRKHISKKIRFEVFKRDEFTCQYCGKSAPDVILEIDHIVPVSKGGDNDLLNLVTSCFDCNRGKSNRKLMDTSVMDKKKKQLSVLQKKQEQLNMMFEWQKGLLEINSSTIERLSDFWSELVSGFCLNDIGLKKLKILLKKFTVSEIMEAMVIATDKYLIYKKNGNIDSDAVDVAFNKINAICYFKKNDKDNPEMADLYYIRGIVRNRFADCDLSLAIKFLKKAYEFYTLDSLKWIAKNSSSWGQWKFKMIELMEEL